MYGTVAQSAVCNLVFSFQLCLFFKLFYALFCFYHIVYAS